MEIKDSFTQIAI